MLTSLIVRLVKLSQQFAIALVLGSLITAAGLCWYVAGHFKIDTDINKMMADNLDWRQREFDLEKAFPQKNDLLVIVIDGDTPELAETAAHQLAAQLQTMPSLFSMVKRPDAIPFFRKNGLLFLSTTEESAILNQIVEAQPMFGMLTSDPSLVGFFKMISLMAQGLQYGQVDYSHLDHPLNAIADTIEAAVHGRDKPLSWQDSASPDSQPSLHDIRKYILTKPLLDYHSLEPGAHARDAIRTAIHDLQLTPDHGVHVRMTGSVALNDEEFASVSEGTGTATLVSGVLVFIILLIALRSLRLVLPILLTLTVGLIATTAFALAAVGSLNLISVAFAVMFIGIAVDFGIQFGVRFRDQHFHEADYKKAMINTAEIIAIPLAMAAASTAIGFLAFIPTAYRGVSELGLIAGFGMIIAFLLNITLLPALLTLSHPPSEPEAIGFRWAAPLDHFLLRYRHPVLVAMCGLALIATIIATQVRFDFDPLNLKDPHTESVSTLFDLMKDPDASTYTIDILAPTLTDAQTLATKLEALPSVDHVITLASFIPDQQDKKLAQIKDIRALLEPTLNLQKASSPDDDSVIDEMTQLAPALHDLGQKYPAAENLSHAINDALNSLVLHHDKTLLEKLHRNIIDILLGKLTMAKDALSAEAITTDTISDDLRSDWMTPDGRALVEVYPKGNPRDTSILKAFTSAVREVAPEASGSPISIQESGRTVTHAFIQAGIYALLAISFLSWLILKNVGDVARLLTPLILAGILTLATITLIPLPLNFANIIALPLLLSLGVSYAIYFVTYWKSGSYTPLQSSMARAVLLSATTVLVAFGSLALSSHPGTASMSKLLTVALIYSLLCTFFILPSLLGYPKSDTK